MFRLSKEGKQELITVCDRFDPWKHSAYTPMAFTEQGVAMLSSVLRSDRALEVNIQIMRAFVQSRQRIAAMDEIKERLDTHEKKFVIVFQAIRKLMSSPEPRKKKQRRIGFRPDDDE